MSHPSNKRERFLIGDRKSKKRIVTMNHDIPEYWGIRNRRLHRNTTTLCSRPCCGNPRRHFNERTMQEKRHDIN